MLRIIQEYLGRLRIVKMWVRCAPVIITLIYSSQEIVCNKSPSKTLQKHRVRNAPMGFRTLDASKLSSEDFMDWSNVHVPNICEDIQRDRQRFTVHYAAENAARVPFPPNTRGFIYYQKPAYLPATAGEIRFRLTTGDNPKLFAAGSDLLLPNGMPWSVPLLGIVRSAADSDLPRSGLLNTLLDDGIVSKTLLEHSAQLMAAWSPSARMSKTVIHSLHQLFHIKFHKQAICCIFVGKDRASPMIFRSPFVHSSQKRAETIVRPYIGDILGLLDPLVFILTNQF